MDSPTQQMFLGDKEVINLDAPTPLPSNQDKHTPMISNTVGSPSAPPQPTIQLTGSNRMNLPSQGRLGYQSDLEFRDIMTGDEETLALATVDTYSRTLNGVLKSILNNCSFYEKLCVHDRDYALMFIWGSTYSNKKEFTVICRHCEHEGHQSLEMTELPIIDIKDTYTGSFEMILQKTQKPIQVRLNTVGDEIMVEEFMAKTKNSAQNYRYEHLMMVASIELGATIPFDKKIQWVRDNVSSKEMLIIKKFHSHYSFGFDTLITHTCPACSGVTQTQFPFQAEDILIPTISDDFGDYLRPVSGV